MSGTRQYEEDLTALKLSTQCRRCRPRKQKMNCKDRHFNHKHIKLIQYVLHDTCPPPGAARWLMEPYQHWRSLCCLIEVDLDRQAPFLSRLDQTYISVSLKPSIVYLISPQMNQTALSPLAINDNASWQQWPLLSLHTHTLSFRSIPSCQCSIPFPDFWPCQVFQPARPTFPAVRLPTMKP